MANRSGDPDSLLSRRRLARNVGWNLIGSALPVAFGLVCIPILVKAVGTDRLGVLALAWAVIGYFALFDFGLARSLTRALAQRIGNNKSHQIPQLAGTGLTVLVSLGVIAGGLAWYVSPILVENVLAIPSSLVGESVVAFRLLALSIPLVIVSTFYRALLEAHQRFGAANVARTVSGVLIFVAPVVAVPFSIALPDLVGALFAGRFLTLVTYHLASLRVIPPLGELKLDRAAFFELIGQGGWMMVTNVVGPIMVYFDRLLIGATTSMRDVAYYATPYEMITKLLIIPASVSSVLFPALATGHAGAVHQCRPLYVQGTKYVFLAVGPAVIAVIVLAKEALTLWLGPQFALEGATVLQVLAAGVLINGLAYIPFTAAQALGRADFTGRLHLLELPFYLLLLWWAVGEMGIVGAAFAWTARAALDAVCLFFFAERLLPGKRSGVAPVAVAFGVVITNIVVPLAIEAPYRYLALILVLSAGTLVVWRNLLTESERRFVRDQARMMTGGVVR